MLPNATTPPRAIAPSSYLIVGQEAPLTRVGASSPAPRHMSAQGAVGRGAEGEGASVRGDADDQLVLGAALADPVASRPVLHTCSTAR